MSCIVYQFPRVLDHVTTHPFSGCGLALGILIIYIHRPAAAAHNPFRHYKRSSPPAAALKQTLERVALQISNIQLSKPRPVHKTTPTYPLNYGPKLEECEAKETAESGQKGSRV